MTLTTAEAVRVSAKDSEAKAWLRALELTADIRTKPARIFPAVIEEQAATFGNAPALLSEQERLSYRELAERSRQYTRWALRQGVGRGDVVGLMMPNRPEYLAIWLGISRTGCAVALMNTNLTGPPLAHSVKLVAPRHVIVASELMNETWAEFGGRVWVHGKGGGGFSRMDEEIERYSGKTLRESERRQVSVRDLALYIYTSGTTGLPKAARVSHGRVMQWSHWFAGLLDTNAGDRMYNCLPMYHSAGGILAPGAVLASGGSVAIRDGFSASEFWSDITGWDCTLFQYIGELCRYLVQTDENPMETRHRLRLCCGNGLQADVWDAFQSRFRIPRIVEFYAATEGNVSLVNLEGKRGAIGRIPLYLEHRFPAALVQVDVDTAEPVRNGSGLCVRCAPGETGEALGRILGDQPGRGFEGYTSLEASAKKILRDVFEEGDAWYRTGDLLRRDEQGYFYFVDRLGDSFRWKGENVSTREVEEACCAFPGILWAGVYGVAVPGADGKAGMAALVRGGELDLAAFRTHLGKRLPGYAQPVFLRIREDLELTPTFKLTKNKWAREGYDPHSIRDVLCFHDRECGAFVRLDREIYERIQAGGFRV